MDKSGNQIGVNPLTKISPITATANIASTVQTLESRAEHLAKQHAGLMAKFAVDSLPGTSTSTATVSDAAKLINQSLKQAEAKGIAEKYISQTVITHFPTSPALVSQQLKATISNSGLFYESHLREFMEGHRQLNAIKLEPQNQVQHMAQSVLPQQLHLFEHQRLSWHGEVWPNQQMDWDVYVQNDQDQSTRNASADPTAQATIVSDITLHLPRLGKVTAKISLKNGRMHIGMLAEENASLPLLKTKSKLLATAIESNGQVLAGLTIEPLTKKDLAHTGLLGITHNE
jgi:hypothetical protein